MKASTTNLNKRGYLYTGIGLVTVWGIVAIAYPAVVLPSPYETLLALLELSRTAQFWHSLGVTFWRLTAGFGLALVSGVLLGSLVGHKLVAYQLLRPAVLVVQAVPPVSWMLLAILWFGVGGGAQIVVVFLALFPIFFFHIAQAVRQLPTDLLEMAKVYETGWIKTIRAIYVPAMKPYWISALAITVGMGWKTIVMAEVISGQTGVGAVMNTSRIYLQTDEVMAWSFVVACLGVVSEAIVRKLSGGERHDPIR